MNETRLYTPPEGFYDQPFTWMFDGSGLTDGANAINRAVYIQRGFGDFILRRVAGWTQVVPAGKYQLKDASLNFLESDPLVATLSDELAFPNGLMYPEQGAIRFDLYSVLRPAGQTQAAQIAFQGVRRVRGVRPQLGIPYRYKSKPYTYILQATVPNLVTTSTLPQTVVQPITDYDFDLDQIIIIYQGTAPGSATNVQNESGDGIAFTATGVTVQLTISTSTGALNVNVVGNNVSINLHGSGSPLVPDSTINAVIAAIAANAAAAALLTTAVIGNGANVMSDTNGMAVSVAGGAGTFPPLLVPLTALLVYDAAKGWISNAPVMDIFYNGAQATTYQNGAIVPSLHYPRQTSIRIDLFSLMTAVTAQPPMNVFLHLVGRNRIPC